jgi:hypothetical protein
MYFDLYCKKRTKQVSIHGITVIISINVCDYVNSFHPIQHNQFIPSIHSIPSNTINSFHQFIPSIHSIPSNTINSFHQFIPSIHSSHPKPINSFRQSIHLIQTNQYTRCRLPMVIAPHHQYNHAITLDRETNNATM